MGALEDRIEVLEELDRYRVESASLRDCGRKVLSESFLPRNARLWSEFDSPILENALLIRALLAHRPEQYEVRIVHLISSFDRLGPEEAFAPGKEGMPILRAARAMHALVNSPGSTFIRIVMLFYYRIVRELYSAHPPEWVTGGARAGDASATTAYATGECIRAVSGLARALNRTADYVGALAQLCEEWWGLKKIEHVLPEWCAVEARRLAREFFTTLEPQRGNVALRPPELSRRKRSAIPFDAALIESLLASLDDKMRGAINGAIAEFHQARNQILDFRAVEFVGAPNREVLLYRSETAHQMALGAIDRAIESARDALRQLETLPSPSVAVRLRNLKAVFDDAATETRRVLKPAIGYLSRVLDRELATASPDDRTQCDFPELAFAASAYGAATDQWHDERLHRAAAVLTNAMSERGRFPLGRPLRSTPYGYKAHVIGSEVIRAVSQVLENVTSVDVAPNVVKGMLMYFHDTAVDAREGVWRHDEPQQDQKPQRWSTAFAVIALDRLNRMLDARINQMVLSHFSWRHPSGAGLEDLFYGDYGLVTRRVVKRDSIAIVLERMRAHVRGLPKEYDDLGPLYSVILHGPPGTGKTTLVEALARSCRVPLVEVTPSDIVIGGGDAVERRARAVFKALALLTRCVIMFDEFDPVLQARDPDAIGASSVFSFLTPGMLPKLKTLHDAAKKRSSAYVLITNLIGKLDPAAIREGRFDLPVGVYPPDLLSRVGRLHRVIDRWQATDAAKHVVGKLADVDDRLVVDEDAPRRRLQRMQEVVRRTRGVSMNTLGKPGWYSAPNDEIHAADDSAFSYIYGLSSGLACRAIDAEPHKGKTEEAANEYREWSWVRAWDAAAADETSDLDAILKSPPDADGPAHDMPLDLMAAAQHCEICRQLVRLLTMHHEHVPKRPRSKASRA